MNPQGWFCVLCQTIALHNHLANVANEEIEPPITEAKGGQEV